MSADDTRYFLDTNIFVYALHPEVPGKAARAQDLIETAITSGRGVVSYQVVQEFFSVALRKFSHPIARSDHDRTLSQTFRPLLAVESSLALFRQALDLHRASRLSWYDALIVAAAQEAACTVLYSEDLQHGQRFGSLTVQNPFLEG